MRKAIPGVLLAYFLLFLSTTPISAALVTISKDGNAYWNVLGTETDAITIPKKDNLEIKSLLETPGSPANVYISLNREDGRVSLNIEADDQKTETDVTGYSEDLVEIEAKEEAKRIKIANKDDKFMLEQNGVVVLTDLPITIDTKSKEISALTDGGAQYLAILPFDALSGALRAHAINSFTELELVQNKNGGLEYKIHGEKKLNILNVYEHPVKVIASVSAANGEVKTDETIWIKLLSLIFS